MCNVNRGPGQELWQLSRVITMGLFQAHGPKKWAKYVNRTVGILLPVNQQVTICLKKSFENHKKNRKTSREMKKLYSAISVFAKHPEIENANLNQMNIRFLSA